MQILPARIAGREERNPVIRTPHLRRVRVADDRGILESMRVEATDATGLPRDLSRSPIEK